MTSLNAASPSASRIPVNLSWAVARVGGLRARVLGVPLIGKLLGANLIVALGALAAFAVWGHPDTLMLVCLALATTFLINTILVRLALLPLDELESVAQRVSDGDFGVRVSTSPIADRRMLRLGQTFNRQLDRVESDRARIRRLVRRSLTARETERAMVAADLREGTAQRMSALALQLSAAVNANTDPAIALSLNTARDLATQMVDEVRLVADSVYPGLLGELGLPAVLRTIGRRVAERSGLDVTLDVDGHQSAISPHLLTAMYRAAEEAVENVEQHAHAGSLWLTLRFEGRTVRLEVEDDGRGFDVAAAESTANGVGIFRARELLEHAGGNLQISSAPGSGTSVVATARMDQEV